MAARRPGSARHGARERTAAPPEGATTRLWPALAWLVVAVAAVGALLNLVSALRVLGYPVEVSIGEGVIQHEALRLSRGLPIYKPVDEQPWWIATYPPLFQLLAAPGGGGLLWPRLLALASTLCSGAALAWVVWRGTASRPAALAAGLFWMGSLYVGMWAALCRVDLPGRALESAALLCVFLWPRRRAALTAAVALATLAMLTKQTMIAGGAACALFLWWEGRRRAAVALAVAWVAATSLAYGGLNLATGGAFWDNVFVRTSRPLDFAYWGGWVGDFALRHGAWMAAALLVSPLLPRNAASRLFLCAAATALPNVVAAANDGVDLNYFFDAVWAVSGLAACALAAMADPGAGLAPWRRGAVAAVLVLGAAIGALNPAPAPDAAQARQSREIVAALSATGRPPLCEFVSYTLAAGHEPDHLPYLYKKLEERGAWDPAPFIAKIERKEYGAVLLTEVYSGRWSEAVLDAIERNYEPARQFGGTFITDGARTQLLLLPK